MSTAASSDQKKHQPTPPTRMMNVWWIFLVLLMLWNFAGFLIRPDILPVVTLPYSVFVEQVKHDNVSVVNIIGSEISGTFVHPVRWPQKRHPPAAGSTGKAPAVHPQASSQQQTGAASPGGNVKTPLRKPPAGWPFNTTAQLEPADYDAFLTTFPESVGDPQLLPLLEAHGVQITANQPHKSWLLTAIMNVLPFALLMGFFWWMGRRAMKQQSSIFGIRQSSARQFNSEEARESFDDVAGADAAKQQLLEEVDFLRHPDKYHSVGARIPRGVLLVGPPGTGKTLLARAVAGEAGVPFFSTSGSGFVEMFVGVGASRVRDLFEKAKETAPAILFIDELDAVGRRRGAGLGNVNDEREQTLNQLLVEMDGFDAHESVIVIAATNRADVLDPALLRPGRFDRQVFVDLPDIRGREGILRIHTRAIQLSEDVDLTVLAGITIGMSGAQLANLCNEAALIAAGKGLQEVRQADFEAALDKLVLGDVRPLALDEKTRRVIAYHESGHALVAWLTPEADPVHKVTIVPHGKALGVTEQRPGADQYNFPESYLLARLATLLGGRTAEELVFGDVTTGAENDLVEATRLARHMVTSWGMSKLGLVAYQESSQNRFLGYELGRENLLSEQRAALIDQEIHRLIETQHQFVATLLSRERGKLDQLAACLLGQESADHAKMNELLGPRPEPTGFKVGTAQGRRMVSPVAANQ